jgi:hypothetical protein
MEYGQILIDAGGQLMRQYVKPLYRLGQCEGDHAVGVDRRSS